MQRVEVALGDGRRGVVAVTDRSDGDLAIGSDPAALAAARRGIVDLPWTWLTQVHGARVVSVDEPGAHAGEEADAAVTAVSGAALAVQAADCAPIALVDDAGAIGVVHAGWRGLLEGVIDEAVAAMRARPGHGEVRAVLGPCIGVECYEFSPGDLEPLVERFGAVVAGRTRDGDPAFDVTAAVTAATRALGVPLDVGLSGCTACHADRWYSHRARMEPQRHGVVAWIESS